jgi:hypothetical protein
MVSEKTLRKKVRNWIPHKNVRWLLLRQKYRGARFLRDDSSVGNSALRVFLASSKRTKSRKLIRYEYRCARQSFLLFFHQSNSLSYDTLIFYILYNLIDIDLRKYANRRQGM